MDKRKEMPIGVDVDNTLFTYGPKCREPHEGAVKMVDSAGQTFYITPHKLHIELVKRYYARGFYIVVWSGNGAHWASQAVKALGLQDYVDDTMGKFVKIIDDKPITEWMPSPIWIEEGKE